MSVQTKINKIIDHLGSISIQDFVEISNFDEVGFYNIDELEKISKKGHFITSPEISSLYGISIANQFLKKFPEVKKLHLLELGPGNGTLMNDIVDYLELKNIEIHRISVLERSQYFQKKLIKNIDKDIHFLKHLSELELNNEDTLFIYSNEFFDAIGTKQYIYKSNIFYEIEITKKNDKYVLIYTKSLISNFLTDYYSKYDFYEGDILEHSTLILNYLEDIKSILPKSFFFSATDYGYSQLPKKNTLRLISNHKKINLFEKFENVDYSFSVNFELFNKIFFNYKPSILSQKKLIDENLPITYISSKDDNILKALDLIIGKTFDDMGNSFFNISFYQK